MPILQCQHVSYAPQQTPILKDISLTVETGDFISVTGPSGSGKSTLLKLFSDLLSPTEGQFLFNGSPYETYRPTALRMQVAYCFQTPHLFGETVEDNLRFPFHIRKEKYDPDRVSALFEEFRMSPDQLSKRIGTLSGGEKQRISLIRSLLFLPAVLLLDEITSALDVDNTALVESIIRRRHEQGITILWVTHSPEQSRRHANRLLTLEDGSIRSLEAIR